MQIKDLKPGDLFSESKAYQYVGHVGNSYQLKDVVSGKTISVNENYILDCLQSADQYEHTVKVGLEDKYWTAAQIKKENPTGVKEGDLKTLGIRSIWNGISKEVFTVIFQKKATELSAKAYNKALEDKAQEFAEELEKVKSSKKGVTKTAIELLKEALSNPVLKTAAPEVRVLRGVKTQWESQTGFYDVLDLDIPGENKRQVNINTIKEIVVNNTRYILEN